MSDWTPYDKTDRPSQLATCPPLSDKRYLVLLVDRFVRISYYYRDSLGIHFSDVDRPWENEYEDYVTAWMPLPLAPGKSEEDVDE